MQLTSLLVLWLVTIVFCMLALASKNWKTTFFNLDPVRDMIISSRKLQQGEMLIQQLVMSLLTSTLTWLRGIWMTMSNWQRNMQVLPGETVPSWLCQWIPLLNLPMPTVSWMQQKMKPMPAKSMFLSECIPSSWDIIFLSFSAILHIRRSNKTVIFTRGLLWM